MTALTGLRAVRHSDVWIFGTMLFSACLSLIASFVLSVDAVTLAADPASDLSCNINAVISCGTVGGSWQAHLFGFPNAFLGLVAEPVVITVAVASLGGVRFPRWFMCAAQVVYTLGFGFAYWLLYQSMFVIGALCPWCLLVTVSTTLVFASLTHVNLRDGNLYLPPRVQAPAVRFLHADLDVLAVTIWLLVLALAVVLKYGGTLFA
ncbi:vitamin K epoxide reductase family protein [Jidongwangia harbinensis]|uniref:vitamin K epoxide reductase family protein n=1 Tax=Jidongwangia harbinensis TaxID=2878561 RepID=UPI001CD9B2CD|nr:vitamin K epoxide reductase family protein [Jidongwangia harbinensis]MCA2213165.1 vitamin K epoxide reductase family protein [Jidongwangia harbinensis]